MSYDNDNHLPGDVVQAEGLGDHVMVVMGVVFESKARPSGGFSWAVH